MDELKKFRVMMKIEVDGPAKNDPEVVKEVMAVSPNDALDKARELVKTENPELNYMKIWFWSIERRYACPFTCTRLYSLLTRRYL